MRWLALFTLAAALPMVGARAADAPKGKICYSHKDGEKYQLHIMNADGTDDHLLSGQTADVAMFPAWSPDGKKIAFMSGSKLEGDNFSVQVINADGTGLKAFPSSGRMSGLPAWSPDGKQVAYMGGADAPEIYIADADGNGARKVSPDGKVGFCPFWSLDGKRLGFTTGDKAAGPPQGTLVWMKLDDNSMEEIFKDEGKLPVSSAYGLSPDGKRLLYTTLELATKSTALCIRDLENKGDTFLDIKLDEVKGPNSLPCPGWSPDGKSFVAALPSPKGTGIFRVSEDGTEKTRLTPDGVDCFTPAWFAAK